MLLLGHGGNNQNKNQLDIFTSTLQPTHHYLGYSCQCVTLAELVAVQKIMYTHTYIWRQINDNNVTIINNVGHRSSGNTALQDKRYIYNARRRMEWHKHYIKYGHAIHMYILFIYIYLYIYFIYILFFVVAVDLCCITCSVVDCLSERWHCMGSANGSHQKYR